MNIFKPLGLSALSLLAVSTFTSCEEHNPFSEQEIFHNEYSKNFFKTYGNFPANQSWDFSEQPRTSATDPSIFDIGYEDVTRAATRAYTQPDPDYSGTGQIPHWKEAAVEKSLAETKEAGKLSVPTGTAGADNDPYYYVEKSTVEWLDENILEGKNNTAIGTPFTLSYSNPSKFALIPIYQGQGTVKYKLHMVSKKDDVDYVIWDNWPLTIRDYFENNGASTNSDPDVGTADFQYNYLDKYPASPTAGNWIDVQKGYNLQTVVEKNIRSKPLLINNVDGEFYFYLEVTSCTLGYGRVGQHHSSREGMMLTLDCPVPKDINKYKSLFGIADTETISNVMVIGCEDSKSADWDINDIVFLYVGLMDLPTKIEAKHSKRYLFEDMGTTVDFDFNDVVVDVTETVAIESNGNETVLTQEAVLRHKCGTLPFQVYFVDSDGDKRSFGNYAVMNGEVQGLNEQYTYKDSDDKLVRIVYTAKAHSTVDQTKYILSEYKFWDPENNNIRIDVGKNENLTGEEWKKADGASRIMTARFNKPGETGAPYIIAVPTTQKWTAESQDFPINDFTELKDPKGE